jgi:paraquat-inducible protein A
MKPTNYDACPDCDLLLNLPPLVLGDKARCPRCGHLVAHPKAQSIERTFALSVAGLILIFPAFFLPLVGMELIGNSKVCNLWSGVFTLFAENKWEIAILVFLASILFPFMNIVLSLLVSGFLYFNIPNRHLKIWLRWQELLSEWSMLQVYMMGIIVACVKLGDMAKLTLNTGLYAFIALLIVTTMLTSSMDKRLFWQRIEQLDTGSAHEN